MRYVRGTIVAAATVAGVAGVLALNPSEPSVSPVTAAKADATSEDATAEDGTAEDAAAEDKAPASAATYTGSVYTTPWGPLQLEATITDGVITDITWISLPGDRHSAQINDRAAPALVEEALAAQSASVDSISGATWTSEGFRTSLQSILDQVGL